MSDKIVTCSLRVQIPTMKCTDYLCMSFYIETELESGVIYVKSDQRGILAVHLK